MPATTDTVPDLLHVWKETQTSLFVRRWSRHLAWLTNQVEVSMYLVMTQRADFPILCTRDDDNAKAGITVEGRG